MSQVTTDPRIYIPITRVDTDARMVFGYGTRADLKDSFGTTIDLDSVKRAIPDYKKWRNIREMHEPSAVGRADEITVDDKGVYLGVYVVDDMAWKKVKEKVYRGFSIGGKKDYQEDDTIYLKSISEFSLVDRPSNEGCEIDEFRVYEEEGNMEKKAVTAPEKPDTEKVTKVELAEMPDLKRWMGEEAYDAQTAIYALTSIFDLLSKEQNEVELQPDQIAALTVVVQKLKEFIASEIAEDNSTTKTINYAEKPDVTRTEKPEIVAVADTVERKGASISSSNMEKLQAIHDHCADMGATCRCDTEHAEKPDITRIAGLEDDVKRLEGEKVALETEVKRLRDLPAATDTKLKNVVVSKEDDTVIRKQVEDEAEIKRIEGLPQNEQVQELVKRAQRNPQFLGMR